MPDCGTIIGMPASSDTPPWLRTPRLKLSLTDAQATLGVFIDTGHRLWAEVPRAADAEVFTRRVNEWQRQVIQWLDNKIGGQVAEEYKVVVSSAMSHVWNSAYWDHYYAERRRDLESETRVLESIAQRLPDWVRPSNASSPGGRSAEHRQRPARITRRSRKGVVSQEAHRNAVMVIHGHDQEANKALFNWLRTLGLQPQEWNQLVQLTGKASPYVGDVLENAFEHVQAVVALFTPDEHVRATSTQSPANGTWRLQARSDVLIRAGMALITHPDRTVLICLGRQELPDDLAGRHYVRLNGTQESLNDIATRLQTAGCDVNRSGVQWLDPATFPDRYVIQARPERI